MRNEECLSNVCNKGGICEEAISARVGEYQYGYLYGEKCSSDNECFDGKCVLGTCGNQIRDYINDNIYMIISIVFIIIAVILLVYLKFKPRCKSIKKYLKVKNK
ncbi:hypothetical protein BCR32DRAFT_299860 [Anaeromyces robustus]|uniref:Uncharacterized protein n=1 Tax=Anaeromyces robustus TaxID=1754192 RepID=A0A1Y1X5Z0_9FUNG|nr:hypothetical protein BCR32DRAFT_299860 [Anaeromyces robustus]|eukprot:ORX80786.1 hypothetical protein BCR32DRAFT_299860 [Anaeromyces robustus]